MRTGDFLALTWSSVRSGRTRSRLTTLGIAIGVAAVVLLTAIGTGVRGFVLGEFTQFGTRVIEITPGQVRTHGIPGGIVGNVRPLLTSDAEALRRLPNVEAVVPVVFGNAQVEAGARARRVTVFGVGADAPAVWRFAVVSGQFLPREEQAPRALAVLGAKARTELFGPENPLGRHVRVGGDRYTVIGVAGPKGQILGFDLDDSIYVPVERGLAMFNRVGLVEIDVLATHDADVDHVAEAIERMLRARHGKEDFTVVAQRQMLDTLGSVLDVLTFAVGALGGISLLVGGIGVLTIMTIAVQERVGEVGLLRALGARGRQVLALFLGEALVLAGAGGVLGILAGATGVIALRVLAPGLPVSLAWEYVLLAEGVACGIGLLAGALPAWRAARLDPIEALRAE